MTGQMYLTAESYSVSLFSDVGAEAAVKKRPSVMSFSLNTLARQLSFPFAPYLFRYI